MILPKKERIQKSNENRQDCEDYDTSKEAYIRTKYRFKKFKREIQKD